MLTCGCGASLHLKDVYILDGKLNDPHCQECMIEALCEVPVTIQNLDYFDYERMKRNAA